MGTDELSEYAQLTIKAFHTQLYKKANKNFDELVYEMVPFLKGHIDSYILSNASFFVPLEKNTSIFRGRNDEKEIKSDFKEFTAPPVEKTKNLRMSREGVSYFYGSLDKSTAKMEATSQEYNYKYIAQFQTKTPLILFDLANVDLAYKDSDDEITREAKIFLNYYTQYISLPIDDGNYLYTQVITHFIKIYIKQHLQDGTIKDVDGILFKSSKTKEMNVVLFYDNDNSEKILSLEKVERYS